MTSMQSSNVLYMVNTEKNKNQYSTTAYSAQSNNQGLFLTILSASYYIPMHIKRDNVWKIHDLQQNLAIFFKRIKTDW